MPGELLFSAGLSGATYGLVANSIGHQPFANFATPIFWVLMD